MEGNDSNRRLSLRMRRWVTLAVLLSIVSVLLVVVFTFDVDTLETLKQVNPLILLVAIGLHFFSFIIWGARMKVMAKGVGTSVSLYRSTEIVLSNLFVAAITPSMAGGEPVRIHLLNRDGMPLGNATAVVLGERVLDAIFLIAAAPLALFVFHQLVSNNMAISSLFAIAAALIIVLMGFLAYAMYQPEKVKSLVRRMGEGLYERVGRKKVCNAVDVINEEIDNFSRTLWTLVHEERNALILGGLLTVVFWAIEFGLAPVILLGLGRNPPVVAAYAAQVILMLIVLIPLTPGSSGLTEIAATTLFSTFIPISLLGVFIVIWRAITYHMNLVLGAFVSIKTLKDTELIGDVLERF